MDPQCQDREANNDIRNALLQTADGNNLETLDYCETGDLIGEYEKLLKVARRRILQWFGNISIGIWLRLHMVKEKYYKNADLEDFLSHEFVCNR